ncbi:GerAB/ArcD/ProY family transporter [Paenibacillus thailandensis]|uniref:GerAB/ArcD/ProY family transporter n=1 Tax=Paenibacillus thailandensis TaxID=393250 RepID=A0ABW5QRA2_9BACL
MNRYFYYSVMLASMMNILFYIPKFLIHQRYTGAVSSLLVGGAAGSLLAFLFLNAIQRFPGKGLPEILETVHNKPVSRFFSFIFGLHWFCAALLPLVDYAYVLNRFLNPDATPIAILILLALVCTYAASRSLLTVALLMELGLILNAPIAIFIMAKALTSDTFNWDAVRTVANYVTVAPNYAAIAAASYTFIGYMHMCIFNRLFPPNFRYRFYIWLIPMIGFAFLLVSFFVPIAFHGTETVAAYMYVWTVTADSMVMSYGFIERVLFLFLFVFLNLSLIHSMSVWHQSMEFFKSAFWKKKPQVDSPETPVANYVICGVFLAITIVFMILTDERDTFILTLQWVKFRFVLEIVLVLWIFVISRKGREKHAARSS